MNMNDIIGKKVLLKFTAEATKDFNEFGITNENMWADVVGVDERLGIWIRHPSYKVAVWWDESKNIISKEKRKQETLPADFFIPLNYIKGILAIEDTRFTIAEDKIPMGFLIGTGNTA